jgi:predicted nucleic acid-binding protein
VALIVVDASIVIGHLDPADALHVQASAYLAGHLEDDLRLPASAYAEVLVDPARRGRIPDIREALRAVGFRVEPITAAIAEHAASLRARSRTLPFSDALVLGTGVVLDADEVATVDRRWRRFQRVHVIG